MFVHTGEKSTQTSFQNEYCNRIPQNTNIPCKDTGTGKYKQISKPIYCHRFTKFHFKTYYVYLLRSAQCLLTCFISDSVKNYLAS